MNLFQCERLVSAAPTQTASYDNEPTSRPRPSPDLSVGYQHGMSIRDLLLTSTQNPVPTSLDAGAPLQYHNLSPMSTRAYLPPFNMSRRCSIRLGLEHAAYLGCVALCSAYTLAFIYLMRAITSHWMRWWVGILVWALAILVGVLLLLVRMTRAPYEDMGVSMFLSGYVVLMVMVPALMVTATVTAAHSKGDCG